VLVYTSKNHEYTELPGEATAKYPEADCMLESGVLGTTTVFG
jgi:hypothetical protein